MLKESEEKDLINHLRYKLSTYINKKEDDQPPLDTLFQLYDKKPAQITP